MSTSIGRASQVVSGNAEGPIFELKDFKNPYDIVSRDDFDTDKSQIGISGTQVLVPNTVK